MEMCYIEWIYSVLYRVGALYRVDMVCYIEWIWKCVI